MRARPVPLLVLAAALATLLANGGWAEEVRLDDAQLGQVAVASEAAEALGKERKHDCYGRGDFIGPVADCYPANLHSLADRNPLIGYRAILKAIDERPPDGR